MTDKCKGKTYGGIWEGSRPCKSKAKLDGYCLLHNPDRIKQREKDRFEKEKQSPLFIGRKKRGWGPKFYNALVEIKNGHNDPRQLAKELLDEFEK
ncbi:MAG: hypothetical protein KAT90_04370 [Gammaproteobacteria bacterium]|nr:hypothetical protein [Gammaproteobacteria bacterium]